MINRDIVTEEALVFLSTDTEYDEHTLEKVREDKDGWELYIQSGCCLWVPKTIEFKPKAGMNAKFYGKGFGYTVRGVVIEDAVFFYRTPEESEQDRLEYIEEEKQKKIKKFEESKDELDARYDALPDVYKQRIDRFRVSNSDFRVEHESYELFCCEESLKIAKALKTTEAIQKFYHLPFEQQVEVADISEDHSGNTFGCACLLARAFIEKPLMVKYIHGALAPLVGCEAYGCTHEETDELKQLMTECSVENETVSDE